MRGAPRRAAHPSVPNAAARAAAFVVTGLAALGAGACATRPAAVPGAAGAPADVRPEAPATRAVPAPTLLVDAPDAYGASALGEALDALGTTARVLMIGAHPDDEDTNLLAWLARGRHVETAYLSLTRGDGGQNLIGNELGEALGAIRTQELLAARRTDGGRQYFTRAFDFGFSKTADETFEHWERDSVLADVVRVVRAFRPHAIVAVFSGTPRDGHGHHQASGQLAREAWDDAGDTLRFPVASHGLAWTPDVFLRARRFAPEGATIRVNVGAYDAVAGRSYAEIAAESRSQHRSQGFGALQQRGARFDYAAVEAARAPAVATDSVRVTEQLFAGADTSWARLARLAPPAVADDLAEAERAMRAARAAWRPDAPATVVPPLAQALGAVRRARAGLGAAPPTWRARRPGQAPVLRDADGRAVVARDGTPRALGAIADLDAWSSLDETERRLSRALLLASGVAVEASAPQATVPVADRAKGALDDSLATRVQLFNRSGDTVFVGPPVVGSGPWDGVAELPGAAGTPLVAVAPDSAHVRDVAARATVVTRPWWRATGRRGDAFAAPIDDRDDAARQATLAVAAAMPVRIAGVPLLVRTPVVQRFADPVEGDTRVPVAGVPGITLGLDRGVAYARADVPFRRPVNVNLRSAYPDTQTVVVSLVLPEGLRADSAARTVVLPPGERTVTTFTISGTLPPGRHVLGAGAVHEGRAATEGYATVAYAHIDPQRLYTPSGMFLSAVEVRVPAGLRVAYVPGVGDEGAAALRDLGIPVEVIAPADVGRTDLSSFTSVVVGPRAYQASDALVAANPKLLDFARRGGTLVVQYGQYEMQAPGLMPAPIELTRPAARVTREDAPVTVLDPSAPLLTTPNRIGDDDWFGWVQERGLYMPSAFDAAYTPLLALQDPGEPENRGALLVTPLGRGRYVYTTLSLFRQLPAGVPGAARLLVNLVAGGRERAGPRME